jgi:hypothetical protein
MIKIVNNEIMRDGIKIGSIQGDHICDRNNKKLALFYGKEAFDMNNKRIAYIEDDYVIFPANNMKVRIEDDNQIVNGVVSDICRAAIRLVLG